MFPIKTDDVTTCGGFFAPDEVLEFIEKAPANDAQIHRVAFLNTVISQLAQFEDIPPGKLLLPTEFQVIVTAPLTHGRERLTGCALFNGIPMYYAESMEFFLSGQEVSYSLYKDLGDRNAALGIVCGMTKAIVKQIYTKD